MINIESCPKCGSKPEGFLHNCYYWHGCKTKGCFFPMSTGIEVKPDDLGFISPAMMDLCEYMSLLSWNAAAKLEKQLKAAGA